MTTEEFFSIYAEIGLPPESKEELKKFFDHADLVKFAKFTPKAERAESDFTSVHDFIELIRREFQKQIEPVSEPAPDEQKLATAKAEEGSL
jgi:hypothetical protein